MKMVVQLVKKSPYVLGMNAALQACHRAVFELQ
jgi:hypothetical protein